MVDGDSFAFIIHPIQIKRDVARKYPLLGKLLTEGQINFFSRYFPPVYLSEVHGVRSVETGRELHGWLIACPYTPHTMLRLPVEMVYDKIAACGQMAERLGAKILGLGAYTSVVGDAGLTIANRLAIPVTTGDSLTVSMAVEAMQAAAKAMDIHASEATVAVVGANGAIGRACAELFAADCGQLVLVGRHEDTLEPVAAACRARGAQVSVSTSMAAIYPADLILTVTSSLHAVIEPEHLKPGAVVCDVARPRDVSKRVAEKRDDVLVIEGGMVEVPGDPPDFGFDFGFPPRHSYACMAETMALALEGRYEDYTIGKELRVEQINEISGIARRHGFRLSGFRSFEQPVSAETIARVKEKAAQGRK